METYPLTFRKIESFCPFSFEELASRLVLREGTHLWTLEPGVFPRNSLQIDKTQPMLKQKHILGKQDLILHLALIHGSSKASIAVILFPKQRNQLVFVQTLVKG